MSFISRLARLSPGRGVGLRNDNATSGFLREGVALSGTNPENTIIPSSGALAPTCRAGLLRWKIYNGGGTSPTLVRCLVTCTDGTTTEQLYEHSPNTAVALSTTSWYVRTIEFLSELNNTSVTITTTLGGTSPTASMDAELVPTL